VHCENGDKSKRRQATGQNGQRYYLMKVYIISPAVLMAGLMLSAIFPLWLPTTDERWLNKPKLFC